MTALIGRSDCRLVGDVRRIRAASEIAFIDATVVDAAFLRRHALPGVDAEILWPIDTALGQIARRLAGRRNVRRIHLFAHGAPGELHFAAEALSLETIAHDHRHLAEIGKSLSPDGAICLWACRAGQGRRGAVFLDALARATGARIVASSGLVGATALGGTWELDVGGARGARPPLTRQGLAAYSGVLVNFTATTGTDNPALSAGDDTVTVSNTNQIQAADRFDGLGGIDAIQIGTAGAGVSINLSAAASEGVDGFLNMEAITFVNTAGTSTATFSAAQFGAGKVSTTVAITGTAFTQALAITVPVGNGFDMSGWTFIGWTSGTDTITVTGSTGAETIVGSSQIDRFVVGNTNQVSAGDRYDGGGGNDILQIGVAGAGTSIDFSAAATDGVDGFLDIDALTFTNTSGTSTATFSSAQFGAGRISDTVAVTAVTQTQAIVINLVADGSLDLSGWTFTGWTSGTDTLTITGSTGTESIVGSSQIDRFVVGDTSQVQVGDKYDGGGGTDILQIGVAGAGTSIDLSGAAADGVNGFVNVEAITFVNTSGTSTATFSSAQFGAGKISTTVAVTGTSSTQAIVVNLVSGGSLNLSGWTFATWVSGTDTITVTGTASGETITGATVAASIDAGDGDDTLVVTATGQVQSTDKYDGGVGTDTLQIGMVGAGVAVNVSAAASDGVNGFLNLEALTFVNTSGTSTATFSSAQFGAGKIATSLAVTGAGSVQAIVVNLVADDSLDLSGWTFTTWVSGTDTLTITGSTGTEVIVGSGQIDRFVVGDTNQVVVGDRYDGGGGNDILQIGVAGAGTSIDLSAAATDGVDGFVSIEVITYVNTSGTSTATFSSAQFGLGRISNTVTVTGTSQNTAIAVNVVSDSVFDISGWTFATWTAGTDTVTITGAGGAETITGSTATASIDAGLGDDTLIVASTGQVQVGDRYDGGGGTDTLQVGLVGVGTSIDLSSAANNGVNGFLDIEALAFVNTSGTSTATFNAAQFGAGKLSTTLAVTGTGSTQALVLNLSAGGSLDLSGWTFAGWTSGTDTLTITGSTGTETLVGSSQNDVFVVGNTNQVAVGDRYDGGGGTDTLQIGTVGAGVTVDLSAAATDGVDGFLDIEALTFVNTSTTSMATFSSAQLGVGKIATSLSVTGTSSTQAIVVNLVADGSLDLSGWTFNMWTSGTDTITITGSTGTETIVGSGQIDRFVVGDTNQVVVGDRYDGGGGNDILQIGVAGAGTSIDLSAAATDGVNGFLSIEAITYVNTSGTSTATFSSAQFGLGRILNTVTVTGTSQITAIAVNVVSDSVFDISTWTFATWTAGTDTVTITGAGGAETITGSTATVSIDAGLGDDTLIVASTAQVQVGDKYDGGGGTDTLQIGLVGAGTSIDLSAAANDGVNGFVNLEAITFVNTSGTSTATFNAAQFGAGKISNTTAVTGTSSTQAFVINLSAGGALDLSGWTFIGWTSGTDTITVAGSTGAETLVGSSQVDRFVVGNTSQVSAGDRYDGGAGADILQIGVAGAGTSIDFSAAATDGVDGFLDIDALAFTNTSGTSTATFSSAQFGAGRISDTVAVTAVTQTQAIVINLVADGTLDLSGWTFTGWTSGTDTITITGSTGTESIVGSSQIDRFVVGDTNQVQAGDKYDAGLGTDILQIGVAGAGTSIDLSGAAADGVNGFLNLEAFSFVNTSGTQTATFSSAQFGAGRLSNSVAITGNGQTQAIVVDVVSGGTFDMSAWTFPTWTSGTDTITVTGAASGETITGATVAASIDAGDGDDTLVVTATGQVQSTDKYDGGVGTDTLQIGTVGAGVAVNLSAAASDGVNGFLNLESLTFANTSGTSTATFSSAQFGLGKISTGLAVTGAGSTQAIVVSLAAGDSLDLSGWTFNTWVSGTDTITITGSTATEVIVGSSQVDRFVVGNTSQVVVGDRYDGAAGNDILQIGVAGAGTSVDLSAAATDGVNGFLSIEAIAFANTSGTSTATFSSAQFGTGRISSAVAVTGTTSTTAIVVNVASDSTFDISGWTFATWTAGVDTITLVGAAGAESIAGSSRIDLIVGGGGADTLTGGGGLDVFGFAGSDGTLSFGGAGTAGSVAGYDVVTDFKVGTTAGTSEKLGFAGATVAGDTAGAAGVASTLLLHTGVAVQSHSISGGLITFDDAASFAGAVTLTSAGDLAAVAQYLQSTDLGDAGTAVAFQATIAGLGHTFAWIQGGAVPDATSVLVDIVNVSGTGLSAAGDLISVLDNVAPEAPSITTIAENGAGGINADEALDGTTVDVSLAATGALAGDTLKLSWGGQMVSYTLTSLDIGAGSVALAVSQAKISAQGDGTFDVTATLTDTVGNVSVASAPMSVTVDTVAPGAPWIDSIVENGADGINAAEASDGTLVVVSLAGTGALTGDTLKIHWGGQTVAYTLQVGDIGGGTATVTIPTVTIAAQGDGTFSVTAQVTDFADTAGSSSPGVSVTVDTVTPTAPVIRPIAENAGGGINAVEAADGTSLVVDLFGTGALSGDTVTVNWGGQTVTHTLLDGDIGAGVATVTVPEATIAAEGDGTFNVTAKLTDIAGNVSAGAPIQSVKVDATVPGAPTITSIVENGGGGIAASEVGQGTPVVVSLAGTGALADDLLTVAWGGQAVFYTLTGADIVAGSVSITVPFSTIAAQGDGTINVTAKLTDTADNIGSASPAVVVTVDTIAPGAPSILSVEENDQGAIDTGEAMDGTPIVVGIAGTGVLVGDTLTVQWGQQSIDHVLVTDDIASGAVTVTVSSETIAAQGDGTFGVTAKLADVLGNSRSESPSVAVTVDTSAPVPPSIAAIPEDGAGGVNAREAADGTPVVVSLIGTGALAGDTLTVRWGAQSVTYVLPAADITAGTATVTVPAAAIAAQSDGLISVSAKLTDAAGNTSFSLFGETITVDTTVPVAPSIESVAENADGGIDAVEADGGTPVVVALSDSGASAGDSVVVGWGAETVSYVLLAADVVAGKVTVQVAAATLAAQGDGTVDVTAKLVDAAGNESASSATFAVTVDTAAPGAPTIESVAEDADGGISHDEASDGTPVVVGLAGTGALAGDTLTVAWRGQAVSYALTATDIAASKATLTIPLAVIAAEGDGTFDVTAGLTDSAGNDGARSAAVTVTVGSSTMVSVATLDAVRAEGDDAPTAFTFTVTLDHAAMAVRTVDWIATGSGLNPADLADFTLPSGTVTFGVGETSTTLTVLISGDADVELDEGFAVALSNPSSGLMIGVGTASGMIDNDDTAIASIAGLVSELHEGNTGTCLFTFVVSLDRPAVTDQSVVWMASGWGKHPAESDDFAGLPAGLVVFEAGETSKIVTVAVSCDVVLELDEGFAVELSQASSGLILGTAIANGIIHDDDRPAVSVAAADAAKAEGDSATTAFTFTLSLDRAALADQTVDWSVMGVGAHAADASDFSGQLPVGTVTFAAGETSKTVTVLVSGDTAVEFDEGFAMMLSNASSGLRRGELAAAGTIGNDDASVVSLADLAGTKTGGNGGATTFNFTVSLDQAGVTNQTVDWSVAGTTAKAPGGRAPAGLPPVGTVQFAAGETSKTVSVLVPGDPGPEFAQGFVVALSNASSGLALGKASATGVLEYIGTSAVSIAALSSPVAEGNGGTTVYSFTVELDQAQTTEQSVAWAVTGTGAHEVDATDFGAALPAGMLVFAAGETAKTLTVSVAGDLDVEFDEGFAVSLTKASSGLTLDDASATATIANDDKSTVSIAAAAAIEREGDGGTKSFTFTVSLDRPGVSGQTVSWSVAGTGANPADAADFGGAMPAGTVTFAAGETSRTVTVDVVGDTAIESDETFAVTLSNASAGLTVLVGDAGATIANDDASVTIVALSADQTEGNAATSAFSFTMTLTGDSSISRSVTYMVTGTGPSPASAADFAAGSLPSGTVVFQAGETSKTLVVQIAGDATVEPDETFVVMLSGPSTGLTITTASATGTIRNDDTSGGDPVLGAVVANDDIYTGLQGQALHVAAGDSVLFNDKGAPPLTASLLTSPSHGTLSFAANGSFDYTPAAGFAGTDSFTYRATGSASADDGVVIVQVTPVSTGPTTTTLNLLSLSIEQQIAAVYTAFFGRGADDDGFEFWVGNFNAGLPIKGGTALLADIASSFAVGDEAQALYPFLANPRQAGDGEINAFLDTVYDNLFARSFDAAGRSYWSNQIKQHLAKREFVGSVLVDIMNGAQNTPDGQDITTLMNKVTVNLEYVHDQQLFGTAWTAADDGAEARDLIHAVTSDPGTVLLGIAQSRTLVLADLAG